MRKRTLRTAIVTVTAVAAVGTVPVAWGAVAGSDASGKAEKKPASGESAEPEVDFNKDGYADLASATPFGDVDGVDGAGYVTVSYGSPDGVDPARTHILHMGAADIPGAPTDGAHFGSRATTGDLDSDGYTDLVVKLYTRSGDEKAAMVLWGSDDGLTSGSYLDYTSEDEDAARDLTAGDFDGDGNTDLVMRTGTEGGLLKGPFTRDGKPAAVADVPGLDRSETILDTVAGDVTGDGIDDLFTFHAFQNNGEGGDFYRGTKDGLAEPDPGAPLPSGETAAVGDVDGDGIGDLVMRSFPKDDAADTDGQVTVVYGSEDGPSERQETIDQDSPGVPGVKEEGDLFGHVLDVADVNGDGYADVVAGTPGEAAYGQDGGGAVVVLHGGPKGLKDPKGQVFDQNTDGVPGLFESNDAFGGAVRLLDVNGDGALDLLASAVGEDEKAGGIWWLPGSSDGITADGARNFGPNDLADGAGLQRLGEEFAR